MAHSTGTIIALRLEAEGVSGRITCPATLRPAAGQYLAASSQDPGELLPVILFPSGYERGELNIAPPLPEHWKMGMELQLRGPLGKGFQMPVIARRIAIAALSGSPAHLLPLVYQALTQNASVVIYAETPPPRLPPEVEILPLDLLPEAPRWADFLALEVTRSGLQELRARLGLAPYQRLDCSAQVMVVTGMACAGLAECGLCAVPTREGWSHACSDGPVYDFNHLELSG